MRLKNKYRHVRRRILLLPFWVLFLAFILFRFLLPDYFVQEKDLDTDSGIIQDVYIHSDPTHKGKGHNSYIDIHLADKPYFIRLSSSGDDKYWPLINNPVNISKPIEVKFQTRRLHNHILDNPNQISIDNKVIIPYNSKQTLIGWFALGEILIIITCLIVIYWSIRTYKIELYELDKKIGQKSKWELFLVWLGD